MMALAKEAPGARMSSSSGEGEASKAA
jgi:hypothetical protein